MHDAEMKSLPSAPDKALGRPPSWARRLYLVLPTSVAGAVLCGQMLVAAVDPYNLYPWSPAREINEDAAVELSPYLLRAVRRGNVDTVLIGGSTSLDIAASDIERLIEGTEKAVNLSYRATRGADLGVVFKEVSDAANVRRVILFLDWIYLRPDAEKNPAFPFHLYEGDPTEALFRIDRQAYELSFRLLTSGRLVIGGTTRAERNHWRDVKYREWHSARSVTRERAMIEAERLRVGEPTDITCADLGAIETRLAPFARALSAAGKRLDVIVPPYAMSYYHWVLRRKSDILFRPRASLDSALVMRRCALEVLAPLEGVDVYAFDGERWLTDDLANYRDAAHVQNEDAFRFMLEAVNAGRNRLTLDNFDAYARDLRERVPAYAYRSSLQQE